MRTGIAVLFLAAIVTLATDAWAVTMSWSYVGNPGNAADSADGDYQTPGVQNFGAVPYSYNIGTYDVTNSQYVEFLNAKDPRGANSLGLYSSRMSNAVYGGINFNSGNANGSKYSVISGDANHPVNSVNWYDAIRFANWMNNGQGNGDTETGAYTLLGGTPVPIAGWNITRNAGATVFLPSENEWYKAAYYNAATSSYFLYPTSSNTFPTASGPTALPNHANFGDVIGNLTNVGAYTGTTSPYGVFDMGGNVNQWNEAVIDGSYRGLRGGSFNNFLLGPNLVESSGRYYANLIYDALDVGFRIAEVPEPSTFVLAAFGLASFAAWCWRRGQQTTLIRARQVLSQWPTWRARARQIRGVRGFRFGGLGAGD